jgi:squalene-hopene/tetraprenyl-beta-curcumene cyclase
MTAGNFWEGELSSSALATATAASAFSACGREEDHARLNRNLCWLADNRNPDGGWGDTTDSASNLPATVLALSAFSLAGGADFSRIEAEGEEYLSRAAGGKKLADAILALYGEDRTFAVPILCNAALAGLADWDDIPALPLELSALPSSWLKFFRLEVVSYALPALISLGLLLHRKKAGGNPLTGVLRNAAIPAALKKLASIQPSGGGFLQAAPLTAFAAMGLAEAGLPRHSVVDRCLDFLRQSVRPDGSVPIDTDLSVWLTSAAVSALRAAGKPVPVETLRWLLGQQHKGIHPFTASAPGGWAWTHRPGGVPDADDTAGVLLALTSDTTEVFCEKEELSQAVASGVNWLQRLQNRDGGWPTFCRGWNRLPFDRSSADLTAHVIRALSASAAYFPSPGISPAIGRGFEYLRKSLNSDGSWFPLWFGSQETPDKRNPVFGTARVLRAYDSCPRVEAPTASVEFLLSCRNTDGGWGAASGVKSTIEETALAVTALSGFPGNESARQAALGGAEFLARNISDQMNPSPIGLYFSQLWYGEKLYPLIWSVEALGRVAGCG